MQRYAEYAELERWTRRVRAQTRRDMCTLRYDRERATIAPTSFEQRFIALGSWLGTMYRAARGGVPAIERWMMHIVAPNVSPERLLPESGRQR